MKRALDYIIPIAAFAAALILRVICLSQINGSPFNPLYLDGEYYNSWAAGIAKGDLLGKEIFYGLPLYPYLLGLVYSLFGQNIFIAQMMNAVMDGVSCMMLFAIGRRLFNTRIALMAVTGFIFFNLSLYFDAFLDSTSLSIMLYLIVLALLISAFGRPTFLKWCSAGLVMGLASLANAAVFIFLPFVVILSFLIIKNASKGKIVAGLVSMALALSFVISVTAVRNYVVGKDLVPVTYHSGITFYEGNNPLSIGSFNLPENLGRGTTNTKALSRVAAEKALGRTLKPSEISAYWFRQSFNFIREDPARYLALELKKAYLFWWTRPIVEGLPLSVVKNYSSILRLPLFGYALISPLAIIGLIVSYRKEKGPLLILYALIASVFLSGMIYFVNQRYRMVAIPAMILFASSAVSYLYNMARGRQYLRAGAGLAAAFVLFLLLNIRVAAVRQDIIYDQLGVSQAMKGNLSDAENSFKRAIGINPLNPMSHYNLGTLYMGMKRFEEAMKEFKEAIRLNPDYADAHNNIGTIYNFMGDRGNALRHFENSLKINPHQENIRMAVEDLKRQKPQG